MERTGKLRLELIDVYGKPIDEKVDVILRHQSLSDHKRATADASKRFVIPDLHANPQGLYRMEIDPPSYMPVGWFVNIRNQGFTDRTITFPVDSRKVLRPSFPEFTALPYAQKLLDDSASDMKFPDGKSLFNGIESIAKAGLLNILAKCHRTLLGEKATVLDSLQSLFEIRGDRFFAKVPASLNTDVQNAVASGLFFPVSGKLHDIGRPGFRETGSFKTPDSYGNLQITFFTNGNEWLTDIDIDDAGGLAHVFQVLRNWLSGRPTHPYDIHQILLKHQELDPLYTLVLRDTPMARPALA
ncbi:MAG: hypothetical protein SFV54_22620 [Bryobacteraceae bacterium]|nr:hypothetical protein [Bryobacteraceae bacterium]